MKHTTLCHWKFVLRVLIYLKGTLDHDLLFHSNLILSSEVTLVTFANVVWRNDLVDYKYVSGHYLLLNNNLIIWSAKMQSIISRSTAEAEYKAIANVVREVLWVVSLLTELV